MSYVSCENAAKEGFEIRDDGFKQCGYCGSIDPVELAELIEACKATMSGSDWKYGWPHKFYVDVVNPHPDKRVEGPFLHMKFYSEHLGLLDDETFTKVAPTISQACGITWERVDGGLYYKALLPAFHRK